MSDLFELKRRDTGRVIEVILEDIDATTGAATARDLTDCTVRILLRNAISGATSTAAATIVDPAEEGRVSYTFTGTDSASAALISCEWEVTDDAAKITTYPSRGSVPAVASPDIL